MSVLSSICILRLSAIGDVCNAVSVVQAIQHYYPDARLTWVIGKSEAGLVKDLPGIELVIFDKSIGWRGYRDLYRVLRGRHFDVLLHMQLALRANLASACITAKRRIGFDRARSKELHSLFVNERIAARHDTHVLDGFAQFADALGVSALPPKWNITLPDSCRQWAKQQLQKSHTRHLLIAPSASAPERNWLPERYAALANHAAERGFAVYLCGGPGEQERQLGKAIEQHLSCAATNLIGKTSLQQLFALIEQASVVVAPDTGPVHMAVAAGTPVLGLYAHSDPARTGPYRFRQYVVEAYHQALAAEHRENKKIRWGQRVKGRQWMAQIQVAEVIVMFDRLVREQQL